MKVVRFLELGKYRDDSYSVLKNSPGFVEDLVLLICFALNMALEQTYGHRLSYWIGGGIIAFVVCDPQFNFALISFYIYTQSLSLAERLAGFVLFNLWPYYLIS